MKKSLIIISFLCCAIVTALAQAPSLLNYQAVARNPVGNVLANKNISVRLSILDGAPNGPSVYSETRAVTTNGVGLFTLQIGSAGATNVTGTIAAVNWGSGSKFVRVEADQNAGSAFVVVGTSQLASVPYALNAAGAMPIGPAGGSLTGTYPNPTIANAAITASMIAAGVIPTTLPPSGAAGGDLSGTYPNPTVAKIQTRNISTTAPTAGQALVWNAVSNEWEPGSSVAGTVAGSGTLNMISKWTPNGTTLGNSLLFDNGTNVGLGTTTPTHRLDITHGGSTGIGINSTAGFSVLDINSATGDAAIRFGNSGTNQWNLRNQPSTNNFELFELGGGGSRVIVQDATGNMGIGESNPTHRLHVTHGGSTGIKSQSASGSGTFSVIDIDADNGDAALRLARAGVNQWNIRNRPADDYLEFFELGGGGSRMVIQDGTGNVGIGETTSPSYKLDVLHGGATGIRSRSNSTFSLIDIDAANGDAALRFAKAGVNQWNTRNRPADDYYEIFELGGGGSRFVIQDGTGNVGIGETTSPSYKLDVLHDGATGIRSRSSSTFSLIDIDAANGDAALRFAKAGVNQWNVRNRPADDYFEIFELGGGGSRVVVQDGTGNVGIGETTSPSYKLDVLHGGATGIRSRSSGTFSLMDIDAANGDAALRFAKAGVNQWNVRNNPATDDLQFFELGGGGERMRIENGTGNVVVTGNLSKGGGSFKIDHPLDPENKYLYHSFVESPDMMNIYNGNVVTDATGKVNVKLPDYFEALNMEYRYQLTVIGSFAQAIINKEVSGNTFEIATNQPNVKVSWQVTGVRKDAFANKNRIPNSVEKESVNKGKYLHPEAFGQSKAKAIGYASEAEMGSSLSQGKLEAPVKANVDNSGSILQAPVVPAAKAVSVAQEGSLAPAKPADKKVVKAETGGSIADEKPATKNITLVTETKGTSIE